eukprot:Nitzschia sp. Nitz4//scaffold331_size19140//1766//2764//NITZ4_008731-RA/size19140-processed-gene-0.23-mRNA-1//-1//CDS//3329548173//4741//frame0
MSYTNHTAKTLHMDLNGNYDDQLMTNELSNSLSLPGPQFPFRLHDTLDHAERDGHEEIIHWLPDGKSFRIRNTERLLPVLRRFGFRQTKVKSFLRQLQYYGFQRQTKGPNKGTCQHEYFVRGNRTLCYRMNRMRLSNSTESLRSFYRGMHNQESVKERISRGTTSAPSLSSMMNNRTNIHRSMSQFSDKCDRQQGNAKFGAIAFQTSRVGSSAVDCEESGPPMVNSSPRFFPTSEELIWSIEMQLVDPPAATTPVAVSQGTSEHEKCSGSTIMPASPRGVWERPKKLGSTSLPSTWSFASLEDIMGEEEAVQGMCTTFLQESFI